MIYNIEHFLSISSNEFTNKFIEMFKLLTPGQLEILINEAEKENETVIPENLKNIIFLSYCRHYKKIEDIVYKNKSISV